MPTAPRKQHTKLSDVLGTPCVVGGIYVERNRIQFLCQPCGKGVADKVRGVGMPKGKAHRFGFRICPVNGFCRLQAEFSVLPAGGTGFFRGVQRSCRMLPAVFEIRLVPDLKERDSSLIVPHRCFHVVQPAPHLFLRRDRRATHTAEVSGGKGGVEAVSVAQAQPRLDFPVKELCNDFVKP